MEFYGRQDSISLLNKRVDGFSNGYRQNIAILGVEFIGKTHLIQYWLSQYCNNFIVPIYLEVKPQEIHLFVEQFIGRFLFFFLKNSQIILKDDINFLITHSEKYIPKTISAIKQILSEKKNKKLDAVFTKLLGLAELFYLETGKRCIIVFDEFHLFSELITKDIYADWRKKIMLGKNTMYVLLSSKKQRALEILASDLALLFGNFEKIELQPFDTKTAQALAGDRLKDLDVPQSIIDFVISFSAHKPFYLNTVCTAFADYHSKNASSAPTIDTLIVSLEDNFLAAWGILNRHFSCVIDTAAKQLSTPGVTKILIGLSSGMSRIRQIAHLSAKTKKEAGALLTQLCALDLVAKNADSYCLTDKLFGFWLRCIYAQQLHNFSADSVKQSAAFKKDMENLYREYYDAQNKAVAQRIMELFNQFSNEAVEIHNKCIRLNHFKEVKLVNIQGKKMKEGILARTPSSLWITGFKEERVSEEDMIDFINACKKFKYAKCQKRIFIVFDEIDANANLIAKEGKIATWDMAFVNSLLDMYGQPRIVR